MKTLMTVKSGHVVCIQLSGLVAREDRHRYADAPRRFAHDGNTAPSPEGLRKR